MGLLTVYNTDHPKTVDEVDKPLTPSPASEPANSSSSSSLGHFMWEVVQTLVLAGLLIVVFRTFLFQNYIVEGSSMVETLQAEQRIIVSRLTYFLGKPQRGDVIIFQFPNDPGRDFVKRIIALPGETISIEDGQVSINESPLPPEPYVIYPSLTDYGPVTLGDNEYFVMGDNRSGSSDSRSWGPLARRYIIGKAWLVYYPFDSLSFVPHADLEPGT